MKVERHLVSGRASSPRTKPKAGAPPGEPSRSLADPGHGTFDWVNRLFDLTRSGVTACVPAVLDIMGGLSEFTGSLVLSFSVGHAVEVMVQPSDSKQITIACAQPRGGEPRDLTMPMAEWIARDGRPVTPQAGMQRLHAHTIDNLAAHTVVGTIVEAIRSEVGISANTGWTVVVIPGAEPVDSPRLCGSIGVGVIAALRELAGVSIGDADGAGIVTSVIVDWLAQPTGTASMLAAFSGEQGVISTFRGDARMAGECIRLPAGVRLIGIDIPGAPPTSADKLLHSRVATIMGRHLIERIIQHEDGPHALPETPLPLSRVTVGEYVARFRDRIPTDLKGADFLDQFSDRGDGCAGVCPDTVYKVRSRTEHHVYEHARGRRLAECLSRASRKLDGSALLDAGKVMYAAHWSHGQRCGFGSVPADALVTLLRRQGAGKGIYGCCSTGLGLGGTVAVLLRTEPEALDTVEQTLEVFKRQTGLPSRVRSSCLAPALRGGVTRF